MTSIKMKKDQQAKQQASNTTNKNNGQVKPRSKTTNK
jgi:hypothetical protein